MDGHRHRRSVDICAVLVGLAVALVFPVVLSPRVLWIDTDHLLCNWMGVWCEKVGLGPRFGHIPGLLCSGVFWVFCCALFTGLCAWEWILRERPTLLEIAAAVSVGWLSVMTLAGSALIGGVAYLLWELRWLFTLGS